MAATCGAGNPAFSIFPGPPHHHPTWAPQTRPCKASSPKGSTLKPLQSLGSISWQSQCQQEQGRGRGCRVRSRWVKV